MVQTGFTVPRGDFDGPLPAQITPQSLALEQGWRQGEVGLAWNGWETLSICRVPDGVVVQITHIQDVFSRIADHRTGDVCQTNGCPFGLHEANDNSRLICGDLLQRR